MMIPNVDHVIDGVYIGGVRALHSVEALREANLRHVLKLYFFEPYWPSDFIVLENPILDGEAIRYDSLRRGVDFIFEQVRASHPILVQCGAGISRSSTFVLAYLIERGYDLRSAFTLLKAKHPSAWPLPALWTSLIDIYQLPEVPNDILKWLKE